MPNHPKACVTIAAYRPLDAQTLPQDRFETIVVDDGFPEDTSRA